MSQITLRDLAYKLNISISTVSKALKGYSDVSDKTKAAVIKLAKELNYTPNILGLNLRTQHTKTIGVIMPSVVHQFFSKVFDGIIKEAEKHGYLVILLQSNEKFELEEKQVNLLLQKRVDGILISLSNQTSSNKHFINVINKGIPIVMFDKISKSLDCSKIIIDDKKAAYDAVCYLIKKGYRKIAHFGGLLTPQISIDRLLGYKKALKENGIDYDKSLVYINPNNDDFNDGYHCADKLIKDYGNTIDAVFAITDVIAVGAIKCFKDMGLKIPKDIAVFGFSNWFMSSVITPTLSTVDQPAFEMGKKAAELLIYEINCFENKKEIKHQKIVLPTRLIVREST